MVLISIIAICGLNCPFCKQQANLFIIFFMKFVGRYIHAGLLGIFLCVGERLTAISIWIIIFYLIFQKCLG
jgi:hypothetical protein